MEKFKDTKQREKKSKKEAKLEKQEKSEKQETELEDFGKFLVPLKKKTQDFIKKVDRSYWILAVAIVIFILLIFLGLYHAKSLNNFNYNGIDFNRTYFGKIVLYTAKVPAIDESGTVRTLVDVDFRNDPRKLENIPVKAQSGIKFLKGIAYVSYQSDIAVCEDNMLAAVNLNTFLKTFGVAYKGALDNKEKAIESNLTYATCNSYPNNTVIHIINGNQTQIIQKSDNCYEIVSNNCEILKATEKFELQILEQYLSHFKKVG
jgi:hypothetical protein